MLGIAPGQMDEDTDLLDAGLDSVRTMELADRLSSAEVDVPSETLISARSLKERGLT